MKVSFDFDGTLGASKAIQEYAKELVNLGHEVHIVTRRYDSPTRYIEEFNIKYGIDNVEREHSYLFTVAGEIGIRIDRIHFTNMEDKYLFFKDKDFLWHLDDDSIECDMINRSVKTRAICCFGNSTWKNKCNKLINNNK